MEFAHPFSQDFVGVKVGGAFGFAVDYAVEFDAGEGLVHGFETDAECALGHSGLEVFGRAEEVALREVDGYALGGWIFGDGVQAAVFGAEEIHDYLEIGTVVAGIGEDKDGIDIDLREVPRVGGGDLLGGELGERRDRGIPGDDVVGDDDVVKAVGFGDLLAFFSFTANDKNGIVIFFKCRHGGVRLDELVGRDGVADDFGELVTTILFEFTTTIGEKNVGDYDTEFVVAVEDLQGSFAFWDQSVPMDKNTVDVKSESHILCGFDFGF